MKKYFPISNVQINHLRNMISNEYFDGVGLGWGPRFCVSNKLSDALDAAGLQTIYP